MTPAAHGPLRLRAGTRTTFSASSAPPRPPKSSQPASCAAPWASQRPLGSRPARQGTASPQVWHLLLPALCCPRYAGLPANATPDCMQAPRLQGCCSLHPWRPMTRELSRCVQAAGPWAVESCCQAGSWLMQAATSDQLCVGRQALQTPQAEDAQERVSAQYRKASRSRSTHDWASASGGHTASGEDATAVLQPELVHCCYLLSCCCGCRLPPCARRRHAGEGAARSVMPA